VKPRQNKPKTVVTEAADPDLDLEDEAADDTQYPSDDQLGLYRTVDELARAMGVCRRTITRWLAQGCPGRWGCGRYDMGGINRWRRGLDTSGYPRQRPGSR
jgi:hypothetical protein